MSRQTAFGKRKPLIFSRRSLPAPRRVQIGRDKRDQAKARRIGDAMKRIMFRRNPRIRLWSVYGTARINGRRQKFSFDIAWDPADYRPQQIYEEKKWLYDQLNKGRIPMNYYYQFLMDPSILHRGRWIENVEILTIGQISKGKGQRGRFESWRPGGRSRPWKTKNPE